jgi:hypothetical protein
MMATAPSSPTDAPNPLTRQLSMSGIEVVFPESDIENNMKDHDSKTSNMSTGAPNSSTVPSPSTDDKIPIANQDPQDPASAPEAINPTPIRDLEPLNKHEDGKDTMSSEELKLTIEPDLPPYSLPQRGDSNAQSTGTREREQNDWNNGLFNCFSSANLCEYLFLET